MSEETKNKAANLNDEDIAKATGGGRHLSLMCPVCHAQYSFYFDGLNGPPPCSVCGHKWDMPVGS